jgi:predicted Zn-dependent peptidase
VIISGKILDSTKHTITNAFSEINFTNDLTKPFPINTSDKRVTIEKDDSLQSSIRIAKILIDRKHPDYPALQLLNHALGGYFGARLMKNIREEKGLTYGIYSSIYSLKNAGYLTIFTDVKKENRDVAIVEIKNELHKLQSQLISTSEFNTIQNHYIGSLQTELATPFAHAEKLKSILLYNLDHFYYQNLLKEINALTPDSLLVTAKKYFNPSSFSVVSVG